MSIQECWDLYKTDDVVQIQALECIVLQIFHIAVRLAGVAVFIMIIIGGFGYLTAGGDPKKTQAARNTLTYAIFGLVAILLAWFILLFVEKFTGVTVTQFTFPQAP